MAGAQQESSSYTILFCPTQAFVLLGASILGGRSAFVLTTGQSAYDPNRPQNPPPNLDMDESMLRLWNPLTGVCTSVKDATGEMRQVCVPAWGKGSGGSSAISSLTEHFLLTLYCRLALCMITPTCGQTSRTVPSRGR